MAVPAASEIAGGVAEGLDNIAAGTLPAATRSSLSRNLRRQPGGFYAVDTTTTVVRVSAVPVAVGVQGTEHLEHTTGTEAAEPLS